MDPFELLLLASKLNDNNINYSGTNDNQISLPFDYRNHIHETLLDPMDSIMLLADQACQKSPVRSKSRGFDAPYLSSTMNSFSNKSIEPLTPDARRVRAMSESYIKQESWSDDRFPYHTDKQTTSTSISLRRRKGMDHNLEFSHNEHDNEMVNEALTLPHMLNQYTNIYNKAGRVGIYTREERDAIIHRFRDKRKRRVWKKKIRYFCRKNLADRRIRIKGRFVKSGINNDDNIIHQMMEDPNDYINNELLDNSMNSNDLLMDINNNEDDDDNMEDLDEDDFDNSVDLNTNTTNANSNCNQQTELDDIQTSTNSIESVKISRNITLTLNSATKSPTSNILSNTNISNNNIYNYANNESLENELDNVLIIDNTVDNKKTGADNVRTNVLKRIRRHSIAY